MENQEYQSFIEYLKVNFNLLDVNFWWKYGLILFNLGIILFLYFFKRFNCKQPESKKNVMIVTAHPDDESMLIIQTIILCFQRFFIPVIKNLKENYYVHLLCLSNGNAYGLGKVREKELELVGNYLSFHCLQFYFCLELDKVEVLNKQTLQDGMQENWDPQIIAEIIKKYIQDNSILAVVTYDQKGISGHLNHIACYKGLKAFLESEINSEMIKNMKFYQLKSSSIMRKYIGILDFLFNIFENYQFININVWTNYKAMSMHASQFVWYRKLFVLFSKYTYINTLELVK